MIQLRELSILTLVLLASTSIANAQADDTLECLPPHSKFVTGKIQSVSPDFVSIQGRDGTKKISVDKITKFRFGDDPGGMSGIRGSVEIGQLQEAKDKLERLKLTGRPFVKGDIQFYQALVEAKLALQGKADIKGAATKMSRFLKSHNDNHRYYEALEVMGDLATSLGKFNLVPNFYGKIAQSKSKSMAARGYQLLGDALILQGDFSKARSAFGKAAKSDDARAKTVAELGLAMCQANSGEAKAAVSSIETIIRENNSDDKELFARAYNALGFANSAAGNDEAALDAYLHTELLFTTQRNQRAEALYHLVQLWRKVKNPVEANRAQQVLKQAYPNSVWSKK